MIVSLFKKIIGSRNDRELKRVSKYLQRINELENGYSSLSDEALKQKTTEFKQRLQQQETLDQILPEAFAAVREASNAH